MLSGLAVIGAVLAIGYAAARFEWLGAHAIAVLSRLAMTVALPALVFSTVASSHISQIFSLTTLVAAVSAVTVMIVFLTIGLIARWRLDRSTIGALSSGFVNSTNLGFPLSMYVFGSVTAVTAIMLFQTLVITPIALAALDIAERRRRRGSRWAMVLVPLRNPVTAAAVLGGVVNVSGMTLPDILLQPIELLSQLCVPLMLLLFGMSLRGARMRPGSADRLPALLAVMLKSVVQPLLAWALARWLLRLDDPQVFTAVVCACLPTGTNVVVFAVRYSTGVALSRTVAMTTTMLLLPLLLLALWLLT